tara:strand:+ start:141 stop:389 length:249 start_codon:yes stop_codon:yes gene_type:complete
MSEDINEISGDAVMINAQSAHDEYFGIMNTLGIQSGDMKKHGKDIVVFLGRGNGEKSALVDRANKLAEAFGSEIASIAGKNL